MQGNVVSKKILWMGVICLSPFCARLEGAPFPNAKSSLAAVEQSVSDIENRRSVAFSKRESEKANPMLYSSPQGKKQTKYDQYSLKDENFKPEEYEVSGRKKRPKQKYNSSQDRFTGQMDLAGRKVRSTADLPKETPTFSKKNARTSSSAEPKEVSDTGSDTDPDFFEKKDGSSERQTDLP